MAEERKRAHQSSLRTRLRLDRSFTSYAKVQAVIGSVLRNRWKGTRPAFDYLNVGCGPRTSPGFVHLDYGWHPGIDVCWDLTQPLPFDRSSMTGIFTEHCLEHISYDACLQALREFKRILRSDGTVRIVVPDAELYLRAYVRLRDQGQDHFPHVQPIDGQWTAMREVNQVFRGHGHQFAYDFETLKVLLLEAGLREPQRRDFHQGRDPKLLIDSPERRAESLYVEAIG